MSTAALPYDPAAEPPRVSPLAVFAALLRRDARVARRELAMFLLRVTMQPLLFVVVFGWLLPKIGFMERGYTAALLPGVLGMSLAMAAVQSVSIPMITDFAVTREIEDRLLAPIPIGVVAGEKVAAGVLQALAAALFVLPAARLVMGPVPGLTLAHAGAALAVLVLGAAAFAALGLWLGTAVAPQHVGTMFSVILVPMIFFGCAYYPWRGLDPVPAVKYAVLANPLVYVAEGLRGTLTPAVPHMPLWVVLAALVALTALFGVLGMRAFERRALA